MSRRWAWLAAVGVVAAAALLTSKAPARGDRMSIYFTATSKGNLEPCGCPVNPSGGLPRRAWYIQHHTPPDHAVVLLDGGDVVGTPTQTGLLQTEYMFRAMHEMGYTVLGLGPRDFVFGIDFLREAERRYGFTFTSANLADTASNDLIFPPYGVMKVGQSRLFGIPFGGQKIAVISVMGTDMPPICPGCNPPLRLLDPFESARRTASAVRPQCDLVVVLAQAEQEELERLLAIPEVDIVIAARTIYIPAGFDNVGLHGHAVLAYTGYEARRIGHMTIERNAQGRIVSAHGDLAALGTAVPDDPEIAKLVAEYKREVAALPDLGHVRREQ